MKANRKNVKSKILNKEYHPIAESSAQTSHTEQDWAQPKKMELHVESVIVPLSTGKNGIWQAQFDYEHIYTKQQVSYND